MLREVETSAMHESGAGAPAAEPPMRPFLVLWSGQAISLIGSRAVAFALIWWLTVQTGSASILATATLLALLPQIVLGPVAGALVDRWNRKLTMLVADTAVALLSAILAWLFYVGAVNVPLILGIMLLRSVGGAFQRPAMTASTSLMVPKRHLTRIQGFNQMLQGGMNIVSAPLGAVLMAVFSWPVVVMMDVYTAVFGVGALLFTRVPEPERSEAAGAGPRRPSLGPAMAAGFRYLRERRGHLSLIGLAALINLCLVPAFSLLPLFVRGALGGEAAQLAWISAAFGVGSMLGGLALGAWGGFKRRILTSLSGIVGIGAATLALSATPASLPAAAGVAVFVLGLVVPMANGPIIAVMQATVAPDYQGRIFTLMGSISAGMTPLGLALAGPIADLIGIRMWYVIGGSVCLAVGLAAFFIKDIMDIESTPAPAAPSVLESA
jgi:DHA3 family macrolide efflux protein-like MFS transporter